MNLIEHVYDPGLVLRTLEKRLEPGGLILVKTPNFDSIDARLLGNGNWAGLHCPRHWAIFNRIGFEKLVQNSNLKVEEFSYTQGAPFWAGTVISWLNKLSFIKIKRLNGFPRHPFYPLLAALFAGIDFMRKPLFKTSQMFFILKSRHSSSR